MSSRIRALIAAGLWQRALSQATRSSAHGMVPGSNIKTGAVLSPPAREGVKSFAVRVTEHDVEVEIGQGRVLWSEGILKLKPSNRVSAGFQRRKKKEVREWKSNGSRRKRLKSFSIRTPGTCIWMSVRSRSSMQGTSPAPKTFPWW